MTLQQKINNAWKKLDRKYQSVVLAVAIVGPISLSLGEIAWEKDLITGQRLTKLYQRGLAEYGDTNRDDTITSEEETAFKRTVVEGKPGIPCKNYLWCSRGSEPVPMETKLVWLQEYFQQRQR